MTKVTLEEKVLKNHINGQWVEAKETQDVINPATGETIVKVPLSEASDVDAAVEAAKEAQKKWALEPALMRAEILYEVGRIMKEKKEHLSQLLTLENGKVLEEARGEVQEGIDMAFYMAGEGRRLFGQTTNAELKDKFAMSVRAPIGVVGIITPWNFPIAIATWKSFPAIVAGNAVIWKPATETPIMAYELVKIFEEAGLPKGIINVVFGSGSVVGEAMVHHPDIKVISFTGSNDTGRHIAAECGRQLKKVSLEMGGKNAVIVMEDADLNLAVEGIIWSAFGTSGQRCTACSRVIVHRNVKEKLEQKLLTEMEKLTIGNGLEEEVKVGPIINQSGIDKINKYIVIGKEEGATLLAGGHELVDGEFENGFYYAPTLFTNVEEDMRIAPEEIFGPVVSLISVDSFEEAIEVQNIITFVLSSSLCISDLSH